jgi:hypothetical protein
MIKPMFKHLTNKKLITLLRELIHDTVEKSKDLYTEVQADLKYNPQSSGMYFLNRGDLLNIIYTILSPEIILIDNYPVDKLPLLINHPWSIPELKTRYENRMRGDSL